MYMEDPFLKNYIVEDIVKEIQNEGLTIEKARVEDFINSFQEQYGRLPKKQEISPIVKGYVKLMRSEMQLNESEDYLNENIPESTTIETTVKDFIHKKHISSSLDEPMVIRNTGELISIPKVEGRRLCPICGNSNWFKIHEEIDKTDIISFYPRVYGKRYRCDGCSCEWKEQ